MIWCSFKSTIVKSKQSNFVLLFQFICVFWSYKITPYIMHIYTSIKDQIKAVFDSYFLRGSKTALGAYSKIEFLRGRSFDLGRLIEHGHQIILKITIVLVILSVYYTYDATCYILFVRKKKSLENLVVFNCSTLNL